MNIIENVLFPVLDEFNKTLPADKALEKSADTLLMGDGAILDSMQLVSFILTVEETLLDTTGHDFVLADEKAMSRRNSPFRSLSALADYINELIADQAEV